MDGTIAIFVGPLLIALVGFCAIWPISVRRADVSVVDAVWGPGFFVQLIVAMVFIDRVAPQGWVILALVGVWSMRLTLVILRRKSRESGEDARYGLIRESWGQGFWWKSFFLVFVLQAIVQWLIVIGPIAGLNAGASAIGWATWVGAVVAMAGLALESVADQQLDDFKRNAPHGGLMTQGLRAYVRHPNYLGEIIFWCGISVIALDAGAWLGLISPILLTVFLTKVSGAPLIEERMMATRPDYPAYRARVPGFIPWIGGKSDQ